MAYYVDLQLFLGGKGGMIPMNPEKDLELRQHLFGLLIQLFTNAGMMINWLLMLLLLLLLLSTLELKM